MGSPYTSVSATGYNANPPPDDGSATEANRITWATIKTKLADVVKTLADSINSNVVVAFGKVSGGITTTSISYQVISTDQGKTVKATAAGIVITTPDATDVGSPFKFKALNNSTGDITLDGSGTQTIDGALTITIPAGAGVDLDTDGTNWFTGGKNYQFSLPRGYIDGCILSNGTDATNDIDISAGVCRDSTNAFSITVSALAGKQLDANWAPGANAGMRNSAAGIANTTYHIYAVAKADGTQDIYAHTSTTAATVLTALQAETGGSGYSYVRLIGSILRETASIVAFTQVGDNFLRTTAAIDVNVNNPGSTAVLRALSIPLGVKVIAELIITATYLGAVSEDFLLVTSPDATDESPTSSNCIIGALSQSSGESRQSSTYATVRTNTSGQVRTRLNIGNTDSTLVIRTRGWTHQRGKNS